MTTVNIVTSDRGWILERLAREITNRLPYVTFGHGPDPAAAIQYYMTYSCRRRRLSPIEVAYFAHLEPLGEAHDRFFATAREVEHSVCHARLYEAVLRESGVESVTTISPGVDLETFRPKLRIGVVGRTYHTGRKGEALLSQVMDIPEIEWSFTGEGWPGKALDLPAEALPDYYRRLDYVLVPALYEGGPMCVVEALACGTEVIAPAIGWVPEFPHVEFQVGDAADLRRVLLELVEKKRALRESVMDRTWDRWAEGHDRLFQDLARGAGISLAAPAVRTARPLRPQRVGVYLHGNEAKSQGGPTVRVPRLARELREHGQDAELRIHPDAKGFDGLNLVHAFNCWSPRSALDLLRRAREAGTATVFSPIFLGIAERDLWEDRLGEILATEAPGAATDAALAGFRTELAARRAEAAPPGEAAPGFHATVRQMCTLADQVILLSEQERARLAAIGAAVDDAVVVRNPVDAALFAEADPALFRRLVGLDDFVLCVARLEPRKNQAVLAHALRETGLPLVLVGHSANAPYRALIERHGGPELRILDRLPPNSPLLASAFAAARVSVLPSWSEGAPLAALEAAAAGASLVLSDLSGEREYFGDLARYADPADPAALRAAVVEAWESRRSAQEVAAQKAFIAERYGWDRHRADTEAAYARALANQQARVEAPSPAPRPAPRSEAGRIPIVFDVTTSAHHNGRWTGIARVEAALAIALQADPRADVRFVTWNNKARGFFEVPFEAIRAGKLARLLSHYDTATPPAMRLPVGAHHVVPGSAWMQNQVYAERVVAFSRQHGLRLTPVIHDVIPTKFPFWFNDGYAPVFEQNLAMLLDNAAHVIAVSQATRKDVRSFAAGVPDLAVPDILVLREGDEISQISHPENAAATAEIEDRFARRPFVLTVGAIHLRKNHRLLYDVWVRLAERMGPRCPHLVLVGGVAWNGHEVARAFNGDPRLKDHVTILEGVDDHALDWLYRNCLFTVYPSLYEGWGLPVGESLRYGKLCIAADTSSVPEIAPGLIELIDPIDVVQWATKVQFYAGSASARAAAEARIAREHRGFTWAQSADQLLDLLDAAGTIARAERPYTYGTTVDLGDRFASSRIRGVGWHACERWGCWSSATTAELIFTPDSPPDEPLVLTVEARAPSVPGATFEARVVANGEPVARWVMRDASPQVLHAVIPADIARRDQKLHIAIQSAFVTLLRVATRTEDSRLVGIGLSRALLAPLASLRDASRAFGDLPEDPRRIRLGQRLDMLTDGRGREALGSGWVVNSAWGMLSRDPRPKLLLTVQELPGCDLDAVLRIRPIATTDSPLLLLALVNGEQAGAWTFPDDQPAEIRFPISAGMRARGEPLEIDLVPADMRTLSGLGLGKGEEPGGFGLLSLLLHPAGAPPRQERLTLGAGERWAPARGLRSPLGADWHAPEEGGAWSFGTEAILPLRLPLAAGGALLRVAIEAFRPPFGRDAACFTLSLGGRVLAERRLGPHEGALLDIAVPGEACGPGGEADLVLSIDAALSPFGAEGGEDERPLGIRLASIERAVMPELVLGEVARFTTPADASGVAAAGGVLQGDWFMPERGGTWSKGDAGAMLLTPSATLPPDWRAFALCRVFAAPATVDVELDGVPLDRWEFTSDNIMQVELRDVGRRLGAGGRLGFLRRDAVSPRMAGRGEDDRLLGLLLLGLVAVGPDAGDAQAAALFDAAGLGRHRALRPSAAEPPRPPAAPIVLIGDAPPPPPVPAKVPIQASIFDLSNPAPQPGLRLFKWHAAERDGRWSHGDYAEIYLQPPTGRPPAELRIEMLARVFGTTTTGPISVEARLETGRPAWLDFPTDEFRHHILDFDLANLQYDGEELCLWLRRPDAMSPADAGQGEDERQLGLLVQTLNVVWR